MHNFYWKTLKTLLQFFLLKHPKKDKLEGPISWENKRKMFRGDHLDVRLVMELYKIELGYNYISSVLQIHLFIHLANF